MRIAAISVLLLVVSAAPALGQAGPELMVSPPIVQLGDPVEVTGTGFQPGSVRIYLDHTDGEPLAEHEHTGQFNFLVEISGVTPGVYDLIACNQQGRDGTCREEVAVELAVENPPATTTTVARTTTTVARTTTTVARTTTTVPRTTTTARPTTTVVGPSTTVGQVTSTSAAPTTTSGGVALLTTTSTIANDLAAPVTADVNPPATIDAQIGVVDTAPQIGDVASPDDVDWPDLEVVGFEITQGIQDLENRMPLVANRRTWMRLTVAADRFPEGYGDDLDATLATGDLGSGVTEWSFEGWEGVEGALWLQHGSTGTVVYPENGPITAYGDGGDRNETNSTLNFIVPEEFTEAGELEVTALIWSEMPGTIESQEPNGTNNTAQVTVDFHEGGRPAAVSMKLTNDPRWDEVDPFQYALGVDKVEESLLIYHPVEGIDIWMLDAIIGPGPEVTAEEDPDGLWDLDERWGEPVSRMSTFRALWDLPDDTWLIGIAPNDASSKWSGAAQLGGNVFWTKGSLTTPAHEMGHSGGLLHVGCKDTQDPIGVPDELLGGAIDPAHATAFPNCSLAPTDPAGHYGFSTRDEVPEVYSNDPDDVNHRVPYMSYDSPEWSDPYHTCLLLVFYGIECDAWQIGAPPLVAVADFGQADDLVVTEDGQWEPMAAADDHSGWIMLVPIGGGVVRDTGSTASVELGPGLLLQEPPSGARQLLAQQLELAGAAQPVDIAGDGVVDAADFASWNGNYGWTQGDFDGNGDVDGADFDVWVSEFGAEPSADVDADGDIDGDDFLLWQRETLGGVPVSASGLWARISGDDRETGWLVPLPPEIAGHGDGNEERAHTGLLALPWAADVDTVEIVDRDGNVLASRTTSTAPEVTVDDPAVSDGLLELSWSGTDADGDELLYQVSISPDGGGTWRPLAGPTTATSASFGADAQLAGGDEVIVRVLATDGLATGSIESAPFSLPNSAPSVRISEAITSVEQYQPASVHGSAVDAEDWAIADIEWTSDLDGALGVATSVSTRWLSVGTHTITATVTDSGGLSTSDSIVLEVRIGDRERPGIEGDRPDVDQLLIAAAGVDPDRRTMPTGIPSRSELEQAAAAASEAVAAPAAAPATGGGSNWVPWAIAAGAAGLAGGLLINRRRPGDSARADTRSDP